MVELDNVSLSYPHRRGETAALKQVSASFEEGSFSAIIGPSGCGKTSLIRIMAGLITPSKGVVNVGGNPLKGVRRRTAVIFQDYGLLPWKTVRANAELPLRLHKNKTYEKVDFLLDKFGLRSFAGHYPGQLSGGMKQRLAIVRALVSEPDLLLMDEPFSSLDALTREKAQDFFLSVRQKHPLTVIMVTHSIEEAVYLTDFVHVINGINPGSIVNRITISRNGDFSCGGFLENPSFRENIRFREYCGALRHALQGDTKGGGGVLS